MIRLSLRDLWGRKLRTVLTMLAIVLGVAMIAGTYVITDQIDNGFHNIFEKAAVGTDVNIVQEGIPDAIPVEACYLGWQQSLRNLARLVEPEINQ